VRKLAALAEKQLARSRADSAEAVKFARLAAANEKEKLGAPELAAWTVVANVLLNLDEFVMTP
jgi:hypothetical protein